MEIEDKITIIEGPPPTFEAVSEGWVLGLAEGPSLSDIALTQLRTFNGPALVERCHRAWRHQHTIYLEFKSEDGLKQQAPIVAARHVRAEEGDMLFLWVRLASDEVELELTYDVDTFDDEALELDLDDELDDYDENDFDDDADDDNGEDFIDYDDLDDPDLRPGPYSLS